MTLEFDDIDLSLALRPLSSGPAWRYDKCHWCSHDWHGLKCGHCICESTLHRPDDTWRPTLSSTAADQALRIMHETGCDGWVASLCAAPPRIGPRSPTILRYKLYGRVAAVPR